MTDAQSLLYPRGIEAVTTALIENKKKEILLCQSPRWNNKWVLPGGHIDPGETIMQAAKRETEEETGLQIETIRILYTPHTAELIGSVDFHRPAHFINFDVYCKVIGGSLSLDGEELTIYKWISPQKALELNLIPCYKATIDAYLDQIVKDTKTRRHK